MAKQLNRLFLTLAIALARRQHRTLVRQARIKAATAYVKAVAAARTAVMGIVGLCLLCVLLISGFLLLHVALFLGLPWSIRDKAVLFLCLGAAYVLVPGIAMVVATSQRFWMRVTQADEIVNRALRNQPLHDSGSANKD